MLSQYADGGEKDCPQIRVMAEKIQVAICCADESMICPSYYVSGIGSPLVFRIGDNAWRAKYIASKFE